MRALAMADSGVMIGGLINYGDMRNDNSSKCMDADLYKHARLRIASP